MKDEGRRRSCVARHSAGPSGPHLPGCSYEGQVSLMQGALQRGARGMRCVCVRMCCRACVYACMGADEMLHGSIQRTPTPLATSPSWAQRQCARPAFVACGTRRVSPLQSGRPAFFPLPSWLSGPGLARFMSLGKIKTNKTKDQGTALPFQRQGPPILAGSLPWSSCLRGEGERGEKQGVGKSLPLLSPEVTLPIAV